MKISHYSLVLLMVVLIGLLACHSGGGDPGGVFGDDPLGDPSDRADSKVQICVPAADGSGDSWTTSVDESDVDDWMADGATLGACAGDDTGDGSDPDLGSGDDDDDDDAN